MKLLTIVFLSFTFAFSITNNVFATVGGSTLLYNFKYNPADESVYYTQIDESGRGCPPTLRKISLVDESVQTVFSCEQGEDLIDNNWENRYLIDQKINEITNQFKDLLPISLKENNFNIDVKFLTEKYIGDEEQYLIGRIFSTEIYQNGEIIDQKEISSCDSEDPFLFEAYSIPGFEKKILLLMSAKRDCVEGGYVSDSVYIVGGVKNLNKDVPVNIFKTISPIQPNKHTLIVYEADGIPDKITVEDDNNNEAAGKNNFLSNLFSQDKIYLFAVIGAIIFLVGLFIGKTVSSRKVK
jgi:hypothetical protein